MDLTRFSLGDIGADLAPSSLGPMIDGLLVAEKDWPHADTRSYLHALAKVVDDLPHLVGDEAASRPSWQLFAYMLLAARDYDAV